MLGKGVAAIWCVWLGDARRRKGLMWVIQGAVDTHEESQVETERVLIKRNGRLRFLLREGSTPMRTEWCWVGSSDKQVV